MSGTRPGNEIWLNLLGMLSAFRASLIMFEVGRPALCRSQAAKMLGASLPALHLSGILPTAPYQAQFH